MKNRYVILSFFIFAVVFSKAQTTFNYTGSVQTYTVPSCAGSISVDIKGAEGSTANTSVAVAGKGGRVQAILSVTPGDVLNIYVGGAGTTTAGGWNGGANPGTGTGAGGGGASDIRRNSTALLSRVIVAAGGGAAGAVYSTNSKGGNGGGINGQSGYYSGSYVATWCGSGGSQTAGGAAATSNGAVSGTMGNGGLGGLQGGGGGGGYYGGGGGSYGGGGGGSSYADSLAVNLVHTSGFQSGNGQVIITPIPGASAPGLIHGPLSVCGDETATYSVDPVADALSYEWTVPSGMVINSGQGTNLINVTAGSLSGDISLKVTNACGTSPVRTFSFAAGTVWSANAGPDTLICKGQGVELAASGGGDYTWTPSTGLSCTNCENPTASPEVTTTYLLIVSGGSCMSDTDTVIVAVQDCGNTIDPVTGQHITVYQDPANGMLYIRCMEPGLKQVQLQLFNIRGQLVYNDPADQLSGGYGKEVNVSLLPKGFYYLRIYKDHRPVTKKIVIY